MGDSAVGQQPQQYSREAEVLTMLGDGSYFSIAYDWYCVKYLKVISDLHYVIILSLLCIAFAAFNITNIYMLLPVSMPMPFAKYIEDYGDEMTLIRRIGKHDSVSTDLEIGKYLVSQYASVWERYDYSFLEGQREYIKNNSSYKVYSQFLDYVNLSNPDSPITKYRYNGRRDVELRSVEVSQFGAGLRSSEAVVKLAITDFDGEARKTYIQTVKIGFSLSDIYMAKDRLIPVEFVVDKYER